MKKLALVIIAVLFWAGEAVAATYTWYFSDDAVGNMAEGSDSNNGTSALTPFKSLSKAQDMLDTLTSIDTATLYFDRGDTWTITAPTRSFATANRITAWSSARDGVLWHDAGTVIIDAYGAGSKPVFDGEETFATCPYIGGKNGTDGFIVTDDTGNLTIRNIEIKRFHGIGVHYNFTTANNLIEYCKFTYFGNAAIKHSEFTEYSTGSVSDTTVQYNEVGYTQMASDEAIDGCTSGWGNAISFKGGEDGLASAGAFNVTVRYNYVYNSYGEGIVVGSHEHATATNIVEYNVIRDTKHVAIHTPSTSHDAGRVRVRYNLIYWTASQIALGFNSDGIYIYDEDPRTEAGGGGDNSTFDLEIYGNIVINGTKGIWISPVTDTFGKIWIYNNTFIDNDRSVRADGYIAVPCTNGVFSNNACLYFTQTSAHLLFDGQSSYFSNWTMANNAYYGGTAPSTAPWNTAAIVGSGATNDPKLNKETGWTTLSAQPTFNDLYFSASDSALINTGASLSSSYDNQYLVTGTDFSTIPATQTYDRLSQEDNGTWEVGALIYTQVVTYPDGAISSPAAPATITEGQTVTFAGSASGGSGSGYTYLWDFNGGAANSTAQNPGAVTFAVAGNYTVSLTVADGAGRTDSTPATVGVTVNVAGGVGGYTLEESFGGERVGGVAFAQVSTSIYSCAIKFTTAGITNLGRADVSLQRYNSPTGTLTARFYTDSSGSPGSLVAGSAASASVDYTLVPTSFGNVSFIFTPFNLSAGTYWLILLPTQTGSDTNYFLLGRDASGTDAIRRGNLAMTSWAGALDYDGVFDLYSYDAGVAPTVPQILSITSATGNGEFNDEDPVGPYTFLWSESVDVTGSPYDTLELGANDVNCAYVSGSGSASIVMAALSVEADSGHSSGDLDFKSPIVLNGGTIVATDDGEPASLLVPTGSTPGSLAYNHDIIISTADPTVLGIIPITLDGTYTSQADEIEFYVYCSKDMTAIGKPNFAKIPFVMDYPSTVLYAYLVSGSGSRYLKYRITDFPAGARAASLNYYGVAPEIDLDEGTIKDSSGNDLVLTLPTTGDLAGVTDIVIAVPADSTVEISTIAALGYPVQGDTFTFSTNVTETAALSWSGYDGTADALISYVLSGYTWSLFGSTVLGDYSVITGSGTVTGNLEVGTNAALSNFTKSGGYFKVGSGSTVSGCVVTE